MMNTKRYVLAFLFLILSAGIFGCGTKETISVSDTMETGSEEISATIETDKLPAEKESEPETEEKKIEKKEETPAPEEVSILMAGDILLHTPLAELAENEDGTYDFHFLFRETSEKIRSADIAIVNQEVIIGGKSLGVSGYPAFNAPEEIGAALIDAGFNVVCHATNHALDKGRQGILNTLSMWESEYPDMEIAGIHESSEEENSFPLIEKQGIKIAILNYTYGTNGIALPSDMPYAVELLQKDTVIRDLELAEETADLTVVCPHWGIEYSHGLSDEQLSWIEIFREHGADVVIGTHPHVIGPVGIADSEGFSPVCEKDGSLIQNNHGDGSLLVFSSIGNFCNWTSGTGSGVADRMLGGLAEVTIQKDASGEAGISGFDIVPIICHVTHSRDDCTVYPMDHYSDALGEKNEIRSQDPAFSYGYCKDLCNEIWGDIAGE